MLEIIELIVSLYEGPLQALTGKADTISKYRTWGTIREKGKVMNDSIGKCSICKEVYTATFVEITPDAGVYICADCAEKAVDNFIWLCITCGKVYINPKELVITKVKDPELKKAYMLCRDAQIIQGIDMCIACHPERIVEYMEMQYSEIEC